MIIDLTKWRTGFCDRLVQISFCVTVARLRGERNLYIKSNKNDQCPYDFLDICLINGFSTSVWKEFVAETAEWQMDYDTVTPNWNLYAVSPDIEAVRIHKPSDIKISDDQFLTQWKYSYTLINPIGRISEVVCRLGIDCATVGLHIRRTDKIWEGKSRFHGSSVDSHEVECRTQTQILPFLTGENRSVFIASDDEDSKKWWMDFLESKGIRVISHRAVFDKTRLRQTSADDFIVDLFGLSKCAHIVGSGESNVLRAASYIGGGKSWTMALSM